MDYMISLAIAGDEKFLIIYKPSTACAAVRQALRWAADEELSLGFKDACQMARGIAADMEAAALINCEGR